MRIAFLGDISFNDAYNELYEKGLDPFKKVSPMLEKCDFVVGNLECLSEGDEGENVLKRPRLKTQTKTLNYLRNLNVSAVTLAHNHVYDNLEDGFIKTVSFLESQKIRYMGAGLSAEEATKPLFLERHDLKICMLSCVHPDTHPDLPADCPIHLNLYNQERISGEIARYKDEGYFVILILHWGGKFEGGLYPDRYQTIQARQFVKDGADLIIGHHSHTLQPAKQISGNWIFYSLGNFCFADILFEGKVRNMSRTRYRETVIPIVELNTDQTYSVDLVPIKNESFEVVENRDVLRKLRRRNFIQGTINRIPLLWHIYRLNYRVIAPIWVQLMRKDEDKSLFRRVLGLNVKKIKTLLKL